MRSSLRKAPADLLDKLQHSHLELILAYDPTIEGCSRTLDLGQGNRRPQPARYGDDIAPGPGG